MYKPSQLSRPLKASKPPFCSPALRKLGRKGKESHFLHHPPLENFLERAKLRRRNLALFFFTGHKHKPSREEKREFLLYSGFFCGRKVATIGCRANKRDSKKKEALERTLLFLLLTGCRERSEPQGEGA